MIEIRQATEKDVRNYFDGVAPIRSMRAFAARLDGRVIGIGGVYFDGKNMVAFSDIKDEMKKYKKDIVRGARIIMDMIASRNIAVFAICADDRAVQFVNHLGFDVVGETPDGRLMIWNNQLTR